jgi:hypothetical protein
MKFKGFGHIIQPWRAHCLATGLAPTAKSQSSDLAARAQPCGQAVSHKMNRLT